MMLTKGIDNIDLDLRLGTLHLHFPSRQFRYFQFCRLFVNPKPFNIGIILGLPEFAHLQGIVNAIFNDEAKINFWKIR